jgi:hypothetical protein
MIDQKTNYISLSTRYYESVFQTYAAIDISGSVKCRGPREACAEQVGDIAILPISL